MLNTKQQEFVDFAYKKFGSNELTTVQLKEANAILVASMHHNG